MIARAMLAVTLCLAIAACASSSQVLTGMPHSPVTPAEVRVYTMAPPSFEEIAVLGASRNSVTTAGGGQALMRWMYFTRSQHEHLGTHRRHVDGYSAHSQPLRCSAE